MDIPSREPVHLVKIRDGPSAGGVAKQRILPQTFCEQFPTPVAGTTSFSVGNIYPNPGDSTVFSRLSTLAACYTEYRYTKLKITYLPLGSAFAANNQSGEIVLSANGNFYSAAPSSVQGARAITPNRYGDAWETQTLSVTQDILGRWRKIRSNSATNGADANLYDFVVMVSVLATPNTNNIGYIMLDGEVEFRGDYYQNVAYPPRTNQMWCVYQSANQNLPSSGVQYTASLSGAVVAYGTALSGVSVSANTIYLAGGSYTVLASMRVTSAAGTSAEMAVIGLSGQYFSNAAPCNMSHAFTTITLSDHFTITVPEDASPATFSMGIRVYGTGAQNLVTWTLTVLSLG